jgi:hypothetical protein
MIWPESSITYTNTAATNLDPLDMLNAVSPITRIIYVPTEHVWAIKRPSEPELRLCKFVDSEKSYILSGVGIVAGKNAYAILVNNGYKLRWL